MSVRRYRLDAEGNWIDKATGLPMETPEGLYVPTVRSDTPTYISPVTKKPIEGAAARRDDLARSGCRPVDPSEFKVNYESKARAIANGGEWAPREAVDLGNGYKRGPT